MFKELLQNAQEKVKSLFDYELDLIDYLESLGIVLSALREVGMTDDLADEILELSNLFIKGYLANQFDVSDSQLKVEVTEEVKEEVITPEVTPEPVTPEVKEEPVTKEVKAPEPAGEQPNVEGT